MTMRCLVAIAAAIVTATIVVLPADARAKKAKRPDAQKRHEVQTPSLDGRITGRPRTCGYETFQYDGLGVPYGPYCH
jgi:hypothetical protein